MTLAKRPIFTLGHSTHSLEAFMALLRQQDVAAVADVRSSPYSRFNPQFNRELLSEELKAQGIKYVFLGRQLGARSEDPACYEKGRVQYPRLAKTPLFLEGIERIMRGADAYRITLMCAEKDPIECHRALLVSRKLFELGIPVNHILHDGAIQTHEELESRLLSMCNLPNGDMFTSRNEFIAQAYSIQGNRVAYQDEVMAEQKKVLQS